MNKFKIGCVILLIFAALSVQAQQKPYSLNEELIYRINFGSAEEVKILLDKGANPNAVGTTGDYAVSVAVDRDDEDAAQIVQALLAKGANPNVHNKSGITPIVGAVMNNKIAVATVLIAGNADYHVTAPDGKTLIQIAARNNNPDMARLIQDKLDYEAKLDAEMRSPEHFKMVVHQYVFDSCAYQYWNFVLGSRQELGKEVDISKQIASVKADLMDLAQQIQKYYPNTRQADLKRVADDATKEIFNILNGMVSNRNRSSQGIGRAEDANERCQKISNAVVVDFASSAVKH